jgi:hypothetical protein
LKPKGFWLTRNKKLSKFKKTQKAALFRGSLLCFNKKSHESGLKTVYFGLKPGKYLDFNCPALKGGAIYAHDILGFSPIPLIFDAF